MRPDIPFFYKKKFRLVFLRSLLSLEILMRIIRDSREFYLKILENWSEADLEYVETNSASRIFEDSEP